ncbi:efflux RND transporter periplasmic adaptor subunit [Chryseobacterium lacus]|uniref:Efflux RND transporter periplasmic adaptor subunit n=1 Tax=Chryseobacterium lacus TaxID=2058346 RepID=A0A368N047_9FLAO|nr:efflux RND transporter periplasmic adaptor subunit [Chryseobacterium lacus]RCU43014.1 efflux RND transporter periplasmic adaptor subunit [Chryseobacterium lacus]RST27866.1 efflux RND transporter periplasmic adaptor subunit [Chryseobacterium lacus]
MNHKIIILALAMLSLSACKKEEKPPQTPKAVTTVVVETRNVTGYSTFPTTIQGRNNNDVRAKIQGYITQVLVDEGQYVTKGQPLFRIETNTLNENASAARAGIGAARSSVTAAEANVKAAQAAVNAAQVEVEKLQPLVSKNIISSVQLQTAQANLARTQAQLSQSIAAKQQASAGVSQAQANFQGIQENINYSVIRAPISGVVGKINLRTGSLVGPGDPSPITTVSDTSMLYAYFSMNEKEYLDFLLDSRGATMSEKLKNMPMVELLLANGDVYSEKGRIEAVTGQIDPATGSIQFRVSFPNPQKLLSNGNSGTVRIPIAYDNVLVLPESATYEQQGLVYIYKVEQDTARSAVISVEDRVNNMVVIKEGVAKGEIVVAEGVGTLKPGMPVKSQPKKFDDIINAIQPVF